MLNHTLKREDHEHLRPYFKYNHQYYQKTTSYYDWTDSFAMYIQFVEENKMWNEDFFKAGKCIELQSS
jgi:hypothetical protein